MNYLRADFLFRSSFCGEEDDKETPSVSATSLYLLFHVPCVLIGADSLSESIYRQICYNNKCFNWRKLKTFIVLLHSVRHDESWRSEHVRTHILFLKDTIHMLES